MARTYEHFLEVEALTVMTVNNSGAFKVSPRNDDWVRLMGGVKTPSTRTARRRCRKHPILRVLMRRIRGEILFQPILGVLS